MLGGLVLMVTAQLHLGASWRIGIEAGARPGLVTGGLYAVSRDAREHLLFKSHPEDPFERETPAQPGIILQHCAACHSRPSRGTGIHSVLSFQRGFSPDAPSAVILHEYDRTQQEEAVLDWKRHHASWGLLQGLIQGSRIAHPDRSGR